MFFFEYFLPRFWHTPQRSLQSSLHPPSPLATDRRDQCDPWGFPLAPGLAQQSPFVFQKMVYPTSFSHPSSFSQGPGKPRKAGIIVWQKEDTSCSMDGGEHVCDLPSHPGRGVLRVAMPYPTAARGRQERAQERKQGSKGHLWHHFPVLFIHAGLFQPSNIKKKKTIQLSLSCLIMSSYKAWVSNLGKLWLHC